jgi:hypothetical protein
VPEGSPDHHAPTQIHTLAHRPAAAGGYQINGTINVTNPDTVARGPGIATLVCNGGDTILSTADIDGIRIGELLFDASATNPAQLVQTGPAGSSDGYPSINVASSVTSFKAYGLGEHCDFSTNSGEVSANAITAPTSSGVQRHDVVTVSPDGVGTISHIIDNTGNTVSSSSAVADLTKSN